MRLNCVIKSIIPLLFFIVPALSFAANEATHEDKQANSDSSIKSDYQRIIWGTPVSPFVRKVLIVLEEKNLTYTVKDILPELLLKKTNQKVPSEFMKISPLGKIPAYEENSNSSHFAISDSNVIVNYLEQKYPAPALRPSSIESNAWVSWFMNYADEALAPKAQSVLLERVVKVEVLKEKADEKVVKNTIDNELPPILDFLENTLHDRQWIAGTDNLSLADICIVSQFASLKLSKVNLEELIGKNRPKLLAYVNKVMERDSFKKVNAMIGI